MDKRNFSNLEDEIKDIVQNAINTMDFYQLNKNIENTVNSAISEVKSALGANRERRESGNTYSNNRQYRKYDTHYHSRHHRSKHSYTHNILNHDRNYEVQKNQNGYSYPRVAIGKVSGILFTVFGWIFLPVTSISVIVLSIIGSVTNTMHLFGPIVFGILPFLIISIILTMKGSKIRTRVRRFKRYISLFKNQGYYSIKDLSAQTERSRKFILKDLRKMIALGMFPEGHIDEQETCIILNQELYQQYLQLQKNSQMQEPDSKQKNNQNQKSNSDPMTQEKDVKSENRELQAAIENGHFCIRQIREANDVIAGEEISAKLDRLETVVDKIFSHVEKHPEQLLEINKFMEYYLPTTLKLVTAYKEFALQPVQGENIKSAKTEIENTLNTINLAFETLLDSLFEDAAMDITTDISVLETMLAQEGLTSNNLKPNRNLGGNDNDK